MTQQTEFLGVFKEFAGTGEYLKTLVLSDMIFLHPGL
jgi:hypothetical protein